MTSALALYALLDLPQPWCPATTPIPLVIYGGASATGAFGIKLAQRSNIHPIIAVAGRGIPLVEELIDRSKGDTVIDYRLGDKAIVLGIRQALKSAGLGDDTPLLHAYDTACVGSTFINISQAMGSGGKIALVNPEVDTSQIPEHIHRAMTNAGEVHGEDPSRRDFGHVYFRYFAEGLAEGWLSGHPVHIVPGGLDGLQLALSDLKEGKASAVKYVVRIGDTQT